MTDKLDSVKAVGVLGQEVAYPSHYDPTLLFPIAREQTRASLGLQASALPFGGVDIWNAYEVSWLNLKGKPQVAVAQCVVPCTSTHIIESKSFKLYLNSFNQSHFENADAVIARMQADLSAGFGGEVVMSLLQPHQFQRQSVGELVGTVIDEWDVTMTQYQPDPSLLAVKAAAPIEEVLVSHLLKSNCPVTGQPDWATLQISYAGQPLDHVALLRYVVSFRDHDEFHEQCVERIFTDIMHVAQPDKLSVYARYTRRGGLDINPFRTTDKHVGKERQLPFNGKSARQ